MKPLHDGLLNAKKVAAILGVRPYTVYQLVRQRELPAVKIGTRIIRFRPESIERWMVDRETGSSAR